MFEFFSTWKPGEVIGLVSVVGGVSVAITAIVMGHWSRMRRQDAELALKRDLLARGMSVEEVERAMKASANTTPGWGVLSDVEMEVEFAKYLALNEVSPSRIEEAVGWFRPLARERKAAVAEAITDLVDSGCEEEQLVAAMRALCRPETLSDKELVERLDLHHH